MSSKSRKDPKKTGKTLPVVVVAVLGGLALASWFWYQRLGTDFKRLEGRWFRADGGYMIEIARVADDGQMDAGYYNPNPINVSRAEVTREQDEVRVVIELKDVNYPGSTYTLSYDRQRDVL